MSFENTFEESVIDVEAAGKMMLQDILAMPEPRRTYYLKGWVEAGASADDGGIVKVATPDRKPTKVPFNKELFSIPPRGRRVSRQQAIRLLQEFGENGFYRGVDMATGMGQEAWDNLQYNEPQVAARYRNHTFLFNENYLIQIPFGSDDEDVVEEASSKE